MAIQCFNRIKFFGFIFLISWSKYTLAETKENEMRKTVRIDENTHLTISVKWDVNPENGEDVLKSVLSYTGKFNEKEYRFVQIARVQTEDESDFIFRGFQEDRNLVRTKNGFYLDQNYDLCRSDVTQCSFFYRDHFKNPEYSVEVENLTQMADFPFGWTQFKRISLQSCLYNTEAKSIEHCLDWGAEWSAIKARFIFEPYYHKRPSAMFMESLNRFKKFYKLH